MNDKEQLERVARAIYPLISGDPEGDHENPFVQKVAQAAIDAMQPTKEPHHDE